MVVHHARYTAATATQLYATYALPDVPGDHDPIGGSLFEHKSETMLPTTTRQHNFYAAAFHVAPFPHLHISQCSNDMVLENDENIEEDR